MSNILKFCLVSLVSAGLVACETTPEPAEETLYQKLGGESGRT